jgi:hypothetical protein
MRAANLAEFVVREESRFPRRARPKSAGSVNDEESEQEQIGIGRALNAVGDGHRKFLGGIEFAGNRQPRPQKLANYFTLESPISESAQCFGNSSRTTNFFIEK